MPESSMPIARSRAPRSRPLPYLRNRHPLLALLERLGLFRLRVASVGPRRA